MCEFGGGNALTQARGAWLFERIVETGSVVLSCVGGDHAGTAAAHRYLGSAQSDVATILSALRGRAVEACRGRCVVAVQDTSALSLSGASGRHGLGPGGDGVQAGFFVHPVVAVDAADEAVLGLLDAQIWSRAPGKVTARHGRPVEEKESLRWITGAQAAADALGGVAAELLVVSDQEGDLYSAFARRPEGTELLVRARHDRALAEGGLMRAAAADWPVAATDTVAVPARPGQPARTARVSLRAGAVTVKRPSGLPDEEAAALELHLVVVDEPDPPSGVAPLCWRLLTSRAVSGAEPARELVRLYRLRWRIEEVFRGLKGEGLRLEETQVRVPEKLFRLAALAVGAAVRILQLVDARDGGRRPMQDVLDARTRPVVAVLGRSREGGTARQRNPHRPGTLAWLSWIVARYGGWNCYGKPPGPKIMARGWERFAAALAGALTVQTELKPV